MKWTRLLLSALSYQVFVLLGSGNAGAIRDAWRF